MCSEKLMHKIFKIKSTELKQLAIGYGACIATDMITVHGCKVGYMYRDAPDNLLSGWVFMSGNETQEYIDDEENLAIYDINTIANYDPDIIPLIESPVGTEYERDSNGEFKVVN